jgi:hypothetical protein
MIDTVFNGFSKENEMKAKNSNFIIQNRVFVWLALVVGFVLLIPLLGNWPWTLSDFIIAGILLFGAGTYFCWRRGSGQNIALPSALRSQLHYSIFGQSLPLGFSRHGVVNKSDYFFSNRSLSLP